eukprot:CAMPEP_0116972198 /NCGR_PEP_ID=MMETSP0467-20121206/53692_1 /TAXON_ID=283647 /ORGANISM="Mesodinium pulex, Strain SPMC105" /LENGTH=65 /DNA_ID=CAMNT_0004663629 /DNA_START=1639 /DNA_END=1836 /DNA_ORIENTATION=-
MKNQVKGSTIGSDNNSKMSTSDTVNHNQNDAIGKQKKKPVSNSNKKDNKTTAKPKPKKKLEYDEV